MQTSVDPTVTITGPIGVPKGNQGAIEIDIANNPDQVPVNLAISTTTGTGDATFGNNTHNYSLTAGASVVIKGVTESSTANNIVVKAVGQQSGRVLASKTFSTVSVALSLRSSTSLSPSPDNLASGTYQGIYGVTQLGAFPFIGDFGCKTGVEIVGTVSPSNYTGTIVLRRTLKDEGAWDGSSLIGKESPNRDDTSDANKRDDDPQSASNGVASNGKVYDIDAPGVYDVDLGHTYRARQNFASYAVLDYATNPSSVSATLNWYSAVSCTMTGDGPVLDSAVSNDNRAATGTIPLSWNLQ